MLFFKRSIITPLALISILFSGCSLLASAGLTSQGQPTKEVTGDLGEKTVEDRVDHSAWTSLLQKHVNAEGLVDYKGFLKDREALDAYLTKLSSLTPDDTWKVEELLAYYINLYNAYTVDLILDHYPLKSIKDIDGAWTKALVPVGDKMLSLGAIENGVLRKMNEPRIHFAINCASISCPDLMPQAFTASNINEQLDQAASMFINSNKNYLSNPKRIKLNKIFDWYKKDYLIKGIATLPEYVNQYASTKVNPDAKVSFTEYDWGLNEQ
ncbi:DUF547 domain-containing protein [Gangjinia marincola]|uniref:DUF547 domain-containing protein n=1 Tax=Gangjinia marincola TaxID=578463 RepID=A0ABP3XVV0_9FLAO